MTNLKNNRFGKEFRLRSKADFFYLKSNSKSVNSDYMRIVYKKSRIEIENTRIGVIVSKKCGKASKRNLIKRMIREQFRLSDHKFMSLDCLVIIHWSTVSKLSMNGKEKDNFRETFQQLMGKISNI